MWDLNPYAQMALPDLLTDPDWLDVILTALTLLLPIVGALGVWLGKRWERARGPYIPQTQSKKDRANYELLLRRYENYLDPLSDLIVIRAQIEAGLEEYTPELEREFVQTRDGIYHSLEKRSDVEEEMGDFQLMEILEGRMVGIADLRKRREELEKRQAEIENHPFFIKRRSDAA